MRISDWSSDVCSSDLDVPVAHHHRAQYAFPDAPVRNLQFIGGPGVQYRFQYGAARDDKIRALQPDACPGRPLAHRLGRQTLADVPHRSEEHTSELQSLMRISYAVFCLKKKKKNYIKQH